MALGFQGLGFIALGFQGLGFMALGFRSRRRQGLGPGSKLQGLGFHLCVSGA